MKRIVYLDILRVLSAILVVCGHVSALSWNSIDVSTSKWQTMNAFDCLGVMGVPIFFMISGAIFLNEKYETTIKKLYLSKILHIFILYHVWLLLYNLLPFAFGDIEVTGANIKEMFMKYFDGRGIYHLWFLPELCVLYMITPVIKRAFTDKKICEYYLVLFALLGGLLKGVLVFDFPYKIFVQSYHDRTSLVMMTGYIGYYVMGHYINNFLEDTASTRTKILLSIAAVISLVIIIVACGQDAIKTGQPSVILNTPYSFTHVVFCFCVFWLMKLTAKNAQSKLALVCKKLSKYTLAVYILHPLMLNILDRLQVTTLNPHPVVMIPVLIIVVFTASALLGFVLSLIPGVRKLVM